MKLILASTSPYRRALLERLGLPFECVAPRIDEEERKRSNDYLPPRQLSGLLAAEKAESVAVEFPEATIIGGDQLVTIQGKILGKPGSTRAAVEQLASLSGKEHELITSIAVVHSGKSRAYTDVTRLRMRKLSREEIERYVAADQPIDCAGSYKLESRGIVLFESILGPDHSAVTGIPLIALTTLLRELGARIP